MSGRMRMSQREPRIPKKRVRFATLPSQPLIPRTPIRRKRRSSDVNLINQIECSPTNKRQGCMTEQQHLINQIECSPNTKRNKRPNSVTLPTSVRQSTPLEVIGGANFMLTQTIRRINRQIPSTPPRREPQESIQESLVSQIDCSPTNKRTDRNPNRRPNMLSQTIRRFHHLQTPPHRERRTSYGTQTPSTPPRRDNSQNSQEILVSLIECSPINKTPIHQTVKQEKTLVSMIECSPIGKGNNSEVDPLVLFVRDDSRWFQEPTKPKRNSIRYLFNSQDAIGGASQTACVFHSQETEEDDLDPLRVIKCEKYDIVTGNLTSRLSNLLSKKFQEHLVYVAEDDSASFNTNIELRQQYLQMIILKIKQYQTKGILDCVIQCTQGFDAETSFEFEEEKVRLVVQQTWMAGMGLREGDQIQVHSPFYHRRKGKNDKLLIHGPFWIKVIDRGSDDSIEKVDRLTLQWDCHCRATVDRPTPVVSSLKCRPPKKERKQNKSP